MLIFLEQCELAKVFNIPFSGAYAECLCLQMIGSMIWGTGNK